MRECRRVFWRGVMFTMFLLVPLPPLHAQPGPGLPFGGELRGVTRFTGEVVCIGCSLEEARQTQREAAKDLYVLRHPEGQVVLKVEAFSDPAEHARWENMVGLSHEISARAPEGVFEELMAEKNLFKKVEVRGLLRSSQTFDINQVQVFG